MAGEDGAVVLPLSVDFGSLDVSPLEEKIAAAIAAGVNRGMADAPKGTGGRAAPQRDVAAPGTGRAGAAQQQQGKTRTDIAVNAADVSREIQSALGAHKFRLNIDESHLINQIQTALNHAFNLTVGGLQVQQGAQNQVTTSVVTAQPIRNTTSQMAPESLDVPKELRESLNRVRGKKGENVLVGAIDDLYDTMAEEFKAAGRSVPAASDTFSKAFAIIETFGDDLFTTAREMSGKYDPKKALEAAKSLSQKFGLETTGSRNLLPVISAAVKAGGMTGFWGGAGALGTGEAHPWSVRELSRARTPATTPIPTPTPVQAPTPAVVTATPAPSSQAMEAEQLALRAALAGAKGEIPVRSMQIGGPAELMRFIGRFNPDDARPRSRRGQADVDMNAGGMLRVQGPGARAGGPNLPLSGQNPEAEIAAMEQLGENDAGVRGLIDWGKLRGNVGGQKMDLRGLAIGALRGQLGGVFKGRDTGSYYQVEPDIENYEESRKKIAEAARRKRARLPGIDEPVTGMRPTQIAEEIARAQYGEEGVAFLDRPEVKAELRKAIRHASRLAPLGMPGSRGEGPYTRSSGEQFSHIGGGSPGSLLAGLRDEALSEVEGSNIDPETRAVNASMSRAENRERIAGGYGLTMSEQLKKELDAKLPKFIRARMQAGGLPGFVGTGDQPGIMENVLAEISRGTEPERLSSAGAAKVQELGGGARTYAAARLAEIRDMLIKGAAESLTDDDIARTLGLQAGSLTPQQAGQYRTPMGKDDARELRGYLKQVASDVLGSIDPGPMGHPLVGGRVERADSFATTDVNRRESYTARSYRAPARQRTDNEKELAELDEEKKQYDIKLDAIFKKRSEAGSDVDEIEVPPPWMEADPAKAGRRRELQGIVGGATQIGNWLSMGQAPTEAQITEFEEQQRLQRVASSKGRTSGRNATGDDLIRAAAGAGRRIAGPVPADPRSKYFSPSVLDQLLRDSAIGEAAATSGGGGGTRPPRGRVPDGPGGGGGGRGFDEVTGAVHVIVDGQPIAVTWAGASPQATQGGAAEMAQAAGSVANYDFTKGRASLRRQTRDSAQRVFGQEVERMRAAGVSDAAIKRAAKSAGLGIAAEAFFGDDEIGVGFGAGGGSGGGGRSALNQRRRRLGLNPIAFRTEDTLEAIDQADVGRAGILAEVQKARRFEPKRGFTASVTDIFTNAFPFIEKQSAAINRFAREGGQLAGLEERTPALVENKAAVQGHIEEITALRDEAKARVDAAQAGHKSTREAKAQLRDYENELKKSGIALGAATDQLDEHNVALGLQREKVKAAREELPGIGGKAAAFGAGAVAAGGAIAVGSLIANTVAAITQGIAAAVGPALDKAIGSPGATAARTLEVAQAGRGGTFAAAAARQAAEAGLPPSASAQLIAQRAQGLAGNQNILAQSELLRVQQNLASSGRGLPVGVDESIRTSTGGILGSGIGIPGIGDFTVSTQEALKRGLDQFPNANVRPIGGPGGEFMQNPQESLFGGQPFGNIPGTPSLEDWEQKLAEGTTQLDNFNRQADEGGTSLKLARVDTVKNAEAIEKFASELDALGLKDFAGLVRDKGLLLQGGASTGIAGARYLSAVQKGASGFSVESLLEASEPQRRAREGLRVQQLRDTLDETIPQQFGMNYAANPLPTGAQILKLGAANAGSNATPFQKLGGAVGLMDTAQNYQDIAAAAEDAAQAAKDFVSSPEIFGGTSFAKEFSDSLDAVADIGRQIASIKIGVETRQAALAADQYDFALDQAHRSLKDARYLTGEITKENKNNVGYLQRQEFLLTRQSQQLAFQMQQRQINFQTALAGFQAPGITGQERAARMEEAKQEAKYAQEQLNIQKQIFNLSGDQFMAQAARQVKDLQRQIALMVEGRSLALDTAKANKDIDALNTRLGIVKGRADAIYQAALNKREAIQADQAELVAATGKDLARVANDVVQAYVKVYRGIMAAIRGSLPAVPYDQRTGGGPAGHHASGTVFTTTGETSMVVGEAGPETVAVIRNPQKVTGMGGGGGVNIGPFILNGGDMDKDKMESLAREISDLVEARLGMKARLVGLRTTTA